MNNRFLVNISGTITGYNPFTKEQIFTGKLIDFKSTPQICSNCKHEYQLQFYTANPCKWCDRLNADKDERAIKGQQRNMWEENN